MSGSEQSRTWVLRALSRRGYVCPERYARLVRTAAPGAALPGMGPWLFLPYPENTAGYCSEALGETLLPFAQAVGHDLIACFRTIPGRTPRVVVINPWSPVRRGVRVIELPDFDAWLVYASHHAQRTAEAAALAASADPSLTTAADRTRPRPALR